MRLFTLAVLAIALTATPAVAADQFDLQCKGQEGVERLRVDLRAGEWCRGDCSYVAKIASVTAGTIVLDAPNSTDPLVRSTTVSRITGAYETRLLSGGSWVKVDRTCEPAPFSGFPPRKF